MAKKILASKPKNRVEAGLALEIGSAMALASIALSQVNNADGAALGKAFATSELDADDFICIVMQLRDRLIDVCRLSGVKS